MEDELKRALAVALVVAVAVAVWLWLRPRPETAPSGAALIAQSAEARARADVSPRPAPAAVARKPGAAVTTSADAGTAAKQGGADPSVFGGIVGMHNSFAVAEALSRNAAAAEARVDELCEKSRQLRSPPSRASGERDAARFMAPLMDYEAPLDQPPGRLHLPDALRDRLREYGDAWLQGVTDADLAGLDFSWMPQLAQFDRWSVLSAGRLRDFKADNVFYFPIPNYSSLMAWAKLRYAIALRRGDADAASAEVRHLVELIRSQQLLISELVAIVMEKYDAAANVADLDLRRKVAFGSIYFGYPGVSPETVRKAIGCAPAPCSALIEAASANRSFASFGASDNLTLVRELAALNGCETALFDRIAEARELPAGEAAESAVDGLGGAIGKWLGEK